ncbi:MAG: PKD domain-containing protein [Bacteroidetes bacterium]|nr:MAG: PKD domain-containing protein [Bacteroidota bacterium]
MHNWIVILSIALILKPCCVSATDRVSLVSGFWGTAGTWSPSGIPAAGDNITIASGHILSMNVSGSCNSLTINGNANWTAIGTVNAGGNLTINNGGSITGASTGIFNIAGTLTVPAGATATIGRTTINVTGVSNISGTLTFNNTNGTKTFTDVTIASGGTWTATVAEAFRINGNLTNNATFLANTGVYTLAGAAKTLGGSNNLIFNSVSISGSYTNIGSLQVNSDLAGAGTLTQGANSTLVMGDLTPANILTASASGNTVRYLVSANMSTLDITYHHLIIEELGGTVNGNGTYSVNGNYSVVGGTASLTNVSIGGNIIVNAGTTLNIGAGPTSISGNTIINGILNITSLTSTHTFNDLTVSSTGAWSSSVAEAFRINGNLSNSGIFTANTGVYTLAGAGKTISGILTIPSISVTGSYTNNGTLTISTALTGAGAFTQGSAVVLNIGSTSANFSVTTFNASASGNTVNYNRSAVQNIRVPADGSYHHLTLAGVGNKTLLGTTDINGTLTVNSALVANNFNITLAGNWLNTGTFTAGTNTVTLDGTTQSITRTGGETFNHLVVSGSGTKTLGSAIITNGNLAINSTLDVSPSDFGIEVNGNWTNNGTFIYGAGNVTFSGIAAQTIGGTTITNFYNITQNNAAGVFLAQHQNLINALTISAGVFTVPPAYNFALKSDANRTARIAAIPGGANIAGNIIMERYTGTGPTDWRFLCSPVSGATIADWNDDFFTSGFTGADCGPADCSTCGNTCTWPSIYTYDETQPGDLNAFGYVPASDVKDPIVSGKGYWVYLGPTPATFEVTGSPSTFIQSPSLTYTNSGDISNDGWNIIANPYPSAIDWDDANWLKSNLDAAVYIYNSYSGNFASYVGGVGVNGGSQFLPSSQAFWVKANGLGVPAITAVEAVKTASENPYPDGPFLKAGQIANRSHHPMAFKDFPVTQNTNTTPNSILLTLSGGGYDDETFIRFMQGATANFDASLDAWKMKSATNISSVLNDSLDFSINSLQELNSDVTLLIRITVASAGTYSIRRDSTLMLPLSSCIILEDLLNGNMTDLRQNISYSFAISDTTADPRFLLHIYAPLEKQAINTHCANDSSGMAIATGTGTGPWNYVWKDAGGNGMKTTNNSFQADTLFNLPVGVFTVEISGSVCGIVTDTIEIKSLSLLQALVNYSDVTCNGLNNGSAYTTVSGGSAPYIYSWSNGANTSALNNLSAGNYWVSVTEAGGCSQTQTILISQPEVLIAGFTASTDTVDLSVNNSVSFTDTSSGAASYLWDFGDTPPVDTSKNPIHYYSLSGTYSVMLVVSNGSCYDTSYAEIKVFDSLNTTGITQFSISSEIGVVYDKGEVFLVFDLPRSAGASITLFSTLGERMIIQNLYQIRKGKVKLEAGGLSPGIYFSMIATNDKVIVKKIILQKH